MITLKQITYALAVERTLHFRKAAEECAISQSALSTALAEMEKQLGFQVFERDNKKVLVTPLGQEVLDKARDIQLQMEDLQHLADAHQQALSTPLTLGIIPTICPYLLPLILPELHTRYPALELAVVEEQSHVLLEQVRTGLIDSAIIALPYNTEGLLAFPFWQENFYWLTHVDDALARQPAIDASGVDSTRLMLLKEGHCLKDHALAACRLEHVGSSQLSATSLSTLVQLVAGKMGSTLIPAMALPSLVAQQPELAAIPLAEPGPHREIAFVVRPNYPLLHNIELLMSLFSELMQQQQTRSN